MTAKPSDITVFSKGLRGWSTSQLSSAAEKHNLILNILNPEDLNNIKTVIDQVGEIVLWRASNLRAPLERTIFLKMLSGKIIFNQAIYETPFIAHKLYQQKIIEKYSKIKGIKTYNFHEVDDLRKAITSGILKYPFVCKKDLGSQGKNVYLIKKETEINFKNKKIKNFVFQNFIKNNGDYRVFVFGGKVLGIMKRTSTSEDEFRNNISLGGEPSRVEDAQLVKKLSVIGLKTASLFNLQLCGVDIIYDQESERYRLMEVNTVPQWEGLQSVCRINIAEEIIKHFKQILRRGDTQAPQLVKDYYRYNYRFLSYRKFHYSARHYLWFGHKTDRKRLNEFEEELYNREKLTEKFDGYKEKRDKLNKSNFDLRQKFLKDYPDLKYFTRILYKCFWAKVLYDKEIEDLTAEYFSKEEIKNLQKKLLKDEKALPGLSTTAVNFIYLAKDYLGAQSEKVDPSHLLKVINNFDPQNDQELRLKIYYLTHCVIAASLFYTRDLNTKEKKTYRKFVEELEGIIRENYFEVTLDNKFEFLVSAKLCDYQTELRKVIKSEAENSLSDFGNYLIDQLEETEKLYGNNIVSSEHRNVLYLMAMFPRTNPPN